MKEDYSIFRQKDINLLSQHARESDRQRKNLNVHELEDDIQRFFNALEPDTYVQPHRHYAPPKIETFIFIQGSFLVVLFNDDGSIKDVKRFCKDGCSNIVMDIKPGVWHSLICEESDTVYFEIKTGPYIETTDKDFASWAPNPTDPNALTYLADLHKRAHEFIEENEDNYL